MDIDFESYIRGDEPDMSFLINFFRNLMMGESNELKNRYMIIDALNELTLKQHPVITRQVPDKLTTSSSAILNLIKVLGEQQLSIKDMLTAMRLKDRENFMNNYLYPAMKEDFVVMFYPNNLKHPRQKYLLTVRGLSIYNSSDSRVHRACES